MLNCSRRDFVKYGMGLLGACLVPVSGWAAPLPDNSKRSVSLLHTHTGEKLNICYYKNGAYCQEAVNQISYFLRDYRTDEIKTIDPKLMDQLYRIGRQLKCSSPFHIVSAYRSPQTNKELRVQKKGVARRSFHTMGRALDIRLPGCSTRNLMQACLRIKGGGVGYYPRSNFVHVDTGDIRTWRG